MAKVWELSDSDVGNNNICCTKRRAARHGTFPSEMRNAKCTRKMEERTIQMRPRTHISNMDIGGELWCSPDGERREIEKCRVFALFCVWLHYVVSFISFVFEFTFRIFDGLVRCYCRCCCSFPLVVFVFCLFVFFFLPLSVGSLFFPNSFTFVYMWIFFATYNFTPARQTDCI